MTSVPFSMIERKNLQLLVSPSSKAHAGHAPIVAALATAIEAVVTDLPVAFYVAEKFKKFGEKEQAAAVLNILPDFASSGLDPAVCHLVVSGERAAARADAARLADAAVQATAFFIDRKDAPGANFDERFSWIPYASLLAVSHPALRSLTTVHPVTRRAIPFSERYISMALGGMVNVRELTTGRWNRSDILKTLIQTRERHQAHPLQLPAALDTIRSEALRSLAEAFEMTEETV